MGVYNSISNVRRIAFIDGLTDARAKELSSNYPFAICYASEGQNSENNHWIPGFWKAGKRYGIQYVDENPITLNGFSIKLSYDEQSGILRLISNELPIPLTGISIIPNHIELNINDLRHYQLSVSFMPSNTTDKSITWTSSDSSKVSVSDSGFIRVNPETCTNLVEEITIRATSTSDPSKSGICSVTVVNNTMAYWYVGQTNPFNMSSITPVVNDTSSPGWRLIGLSIGTYTMNNPLWDGGLNSIITGPSKATTYVALPNNVLKVRDGDGNDVTNSVYNIVGIKSINNVEYYIYSVDMNKVFNAIIY